MPINLPQFNDLNVPQALSQGNQLAAQQANVMAAGQQMGQKNALAPDVMAQAQLKTDADRHQFMINTLQTMVDPGSWQAGRQALISKGMPETQIPQTFDPKYRAAVLATGSSDGSGPASVQEYKYYQSLPADQQKTFIGLKRQNQLLNLGDRVIVNAPTGKEVYQKGVPTQQRPGYRADVKTAETIAASQAKNKAALPQTLANSEMAINTVQQLLDHPGLKYITGMYSKAPIIPGTEQAAAKAIYDQLSGQQFLQAYQTLKGGGQITEIEGAKAEASLSKMQRAVNYKDFIKAGKEYIGILEKGMERAKKMAGEGQPAAPQQAIDYLIQNNTPEMQQLFKAKYGYLP